MRTTQNRAPGNLFKNSESRKNEREMANKAESLMGFLLNASSCIGKGLMLTFCRKESKKIFTKIRFYIQLMDLRNRLFIGALCQKKKNHQKENS